MRKETKSHRSSRILQSSIHGEIRDKHRNKFSILTEVEEQNAALETVRKLENQRQDDEDAEPADKQQLKGIEEYSVTNWFTIQYNVTIFYF